MPDHQDPIGQHTPAFEPTHPAALDASPTAHPPPPPPAEPAHPPEALQIRFTGSGSEYFRIWIVNLLLTLVTLGIYFPWAKVRRLRYFYGNTLVNGDPLDFHGNPKQMLRGYLLVGALFGLYSVAGKFSPVAGLVAFVIVVGVWPALLKSAMQFRLANTSWRGLRFRFTGSTKEAYLAVLPLFVLPLFFVGLGVLVPTDPNAGAKPPSWLPYVGIVMFLLAVLVPPWMMWRLKGFQHNHYQLASLGTRFDAKLRSFYGLSLKTFGMTLLVMVPTFIVAMGLFGAAAAATGGKPPSPQAQLTLSLAVGFLVWFFVLAFIKPYVTARTQNLVWSATSGKDFQFKSGLRFRSLLWLTLKNWLLTVFTLGLYWPFAAVATTRMRLEAVSVDTQVDVDALVAQQRQTDGEAAGDAAGDLFGLDIGF